MKLYRHLSDYKRPKSGVALAIGNFDGFHKGHQAVIAAMREKALKFGLKSAVMIFEPQPLEFFAKAVPARLYSIRDKLKAFKEAGVDIVFCMPFKKSFCQMSDREFVLDLLVKKLGVKSITVGSLFTFGKGGVSGIEELKALAKEAGIEAGAISGVAPSGTRVSSTMIRALIQSGDFTTAKNEIGRPYSISGKVLHGNALGRTLGFPTANINLNRIVCPLVGVYAVKVKTSYGMFKGMANVGTRPTVEKGRLKNLLEVNLFNFNADLYGQEIEVFFVKKIRDEKKFNDLNSLKEQLHVDRKTAMALLENSDNNLNIVNE